MYTWSTSAFLFNWVCRPQNGVQASSMVPVSSSEHAQQLALRVQQLCVLRELWNELQVARAMPNGLQPRGGPTAVFSETALLLLLLSMLYSVFDAQPSAVNLERLNPSSAGFRAAIASVLQSWKKIAVPITRIRHNFAFHGSARRDGTENAMKAVMELGSDGVAIAFELIEELGRIYPWLVLEARGGFHLATALEENFRDVLAARSEVREALLEARRTWAGGSPIEHIDRAVSLLQGAVSTWEGLRLGLGSAPPPDDQGVFMEVWDADMNRLIEEVELLRKLHEAQASAKKMLASIASPKVSTSPDDTLRQSLATTAAALSAWRGLLHSRPKALHALDEAEASVSRLVAALALDEAT
jgi:hypothetical protein